MKPPSRERRFEGHTMMNRNTRKHSSKAQKELYSAVNQLVIYQDALELDNGYLEKHRRQGDHKDTFHHRCSMAILACVRAVPKSYMLGTGSFVPSMPRLGYIPVSWASKWR
jgi:hypothetical protein